MALCDTVETFYPCPCCGGELKVYQNIYYEGGAGPPFLYHRPKGIYPNPLDQDWVEIEEVEDVFTNK